MGDVLIGWYDWLKAFHVISVIAWMAGLLYLPRLFVHHVERARGHPEMAETFVMMERKLYRFIMTPAMISSWVFGILMLLALGLEGILASAWLWVKIVLVIGMSGFHDLLGRWRKELEAGDCGRSGRFFRFMNEVPTLLMIVIVVLAVAEPF